MALTSSATAAATDGRRVLEPTERFSEVLFGLIMVLTFTGSLSAAESGHAEVRTMLIGAIGCNLAWGIVDAIMYVLNSLGSRGSNLLTLRRVRSASEQARAHRLIAGAVPPAIAAALRPEDLERIRQGLITQPEPPRRAPLRREDFLGALAAFLLVFLSTFPVVIPFLILSDAMLALRISNGIAIVLLFVAGYSLAKSSGHRPWLTGLVMVGIGVALVGLTIALGG
jgi:VIT1/CCC1 family predicted Fe2+/Mn2+ transporter